MNPLLKLLPISYPIIQAGMVWVSGGKLAAASAEAGILGVVGAGSMNPELLDQHLKKALSLTSHPERLAVNVPLLYEKTGEQIDVALKNGIKIFITSAGSPKTWTKTLKDQGATVIHVTSSPELAKKCEAAGVDAVVAEGFEAGGHNGRDEITTLVLIPQVARAVKIPVIAAGGIGDGSSIAAVMSLGASGAQLGTRFLATQESSAHSDYKKLIVDAGSDATMLMMKKVVPVRLVKNAFYEGVRDLEMKNASKEELETFLGRGRAKAGMLEGDLVNGELEAGQVAALVNDIPTVKELVSRLLREYEEAVASLPKKF